MQFRIGERDPDTGLYYVIHPDGSRLLNGIKIFNSAYTDGDTVLATERSDGMMILYGVNAVKDVSSPSIVLSNSEIKVRQFGERPIGYLQGQVFNNEEEEELPRITITLAPNSPPVAKPFGDVHYPRFGVLESIRLILRFTLDRPFRRELLLDISLEDDDKSDPRDIISMRSIGDNEYLRRYYSPSDDKIKAKIKIPANSKFIDVEFRPSDSSNFFGKTSYTAVLKSSFAIPKARYIKADVPISFKVDRALIYKRVGSKIGINRGIYEYPQMFTSDIDIASLPYMLAVGAGANTSQLTFLDFNSYPPDSPPYRQGVRTGYFPGTQIGTLNNPDTTPDAWDEVYYLEFILPNLLPRSPSINKRYIYVVETRAALHKEPPVDLPDFRNRSWRQRVSAEISGCITYTYFPFPPVYQSYGQVPFYAVDILPDLVTPYNRPRTQHLGHVESNWLSRAVSGTPGVANSQTFYQSCLKIDTQNPSQSKFIPCTSSIGNVVNPNPETFYLP